MKFKQKDLYIGIDIGSATIKAVEIEIASLGEVFLRKANFVSTAEGVKKAVAGMAIRKAKTIGVVDCPATCVRYVTIPLMSEKEIPEAAKWEIKDKIPFPLDEVTLGHEVQYEVEEEGVKKLRVKVAITANKNIDNLLKALGSAGIEPVSILESPLTCEFLSEQMNFTKDDTVAIVDLGSDLAGITIIKNGKLKFHRKINSTGAAITKALTSVLVSERGRIELVAEEAERIKQIYGLPSKPTTELIEGKITVAQLVSLMRPATERLLQEIELSLDYYREGSGGDRVTSVILFGGGAQLKGLAEFLRENLDMPVSVGNPFKGMTILKAGAENLDLIAHRFANVVGAAISRGRGINLLPRELKQKTVRTFEHAAIEAVVAAVVVALILVSIGMRIQSVNYGKKLDAGNFEMKAMLPQLEIAFNYERLQSEGAERKAFIERTLASTPPCRDVLKELSNKLSREAVLTEMRMERGDLILKGEIFSGAQDRNKAISNLISNLEGGLFENVSLISARMGEGQGAKTEFEIKCSFSKR